MLVAVCSTRMNSWKQPLGKLGSKSPPRAGQLPLFLDASTAPGCDFILHTNNEYYPPTFLLGKMVPGFHMAQYCLFPFLSPLQDWELLDGRDCILYICLCDPHDQDRIWHKTGD